MQFWPLDEYLYHPNNDEVTEKMSCSNCSFRVTHSFKVLDATLVVILRAKLSGGIIVLLSMVKKTHNYYFCCFTSF